MLEFRVNSAVNGLRVAAWQGFFLGVSLHCCPTPLKSSNVAVQFVTCEIRERA
jgi:hypothetical protein